ncbi:MAG: LTA synthase family protein [Pseudomonadales bacterium]|nr:LTA synthase family protein [Pseudomonadales bacterium]
MAWLHSRRIRYLAGCMLIFLGVLLVLRGVFLFGFSDVGPEYEPAGDLLRTVGVGVRFDLRLAILLILPLAFAAAIPRFNLMSSPVLRRVARVYLFTAIITTLFLYIIDFGHYAYLGTRLNATVFRFLQDPAISSQMVWQSYPVIWISLAWIAATVVTYLAMKRLETVTLDQPPQAIGRYAKVTGVTVMAVLILAGLLGRISDINPLNPVPLRWNEAFFAGNQDLGALGLNPIIFLYDTMDAPSDPYDIEQVREHYPLIAKYLGAPASEGESPDFKRTIEPRVASQSPPNVVFVMLESLGASRLGIYGNPLDPSPNMDRIARQGWLFRHFYVPVTGTSKTVWASITGIPDVSKTLTATRNPFIAHQHTIFNAFEAYRKFYFIGGNSSWANINALIRQSIDGVELYEEGDWQSPNVDVWGISDYDLFMESEAILDALPDSQPFIAYIQTAGNHRPFTIPEETHGFEPVTIPGDQLESFGFRSLEQYNAVRLLDFNIGKFLEKAATRSYFDNTIFVFFGDHNNRITTLSHMPPAFEELGLESNHVPHMIFAPALLQPRIFEQATSLVDMLPTVAGLAGIGYTNTTLGRDVLADAAEGTRAVPLVLEEGSFPVIGAVTKDFLLRMNHDGTDASLHDLSSETPGENVAQEYPGEFERLQPLTRGLYETSRYLLYHNVVGDP